MLVIAQLSIGETKTGYSVSFETVPTFLNQMFVTYYGLGSEAEADVLAAAPATAEMVKPENLLAYLAKPEMKGRIDVMEFCGGSAGVTRIAIRRRLKTGINADIICCTTP